MKGRVNALDIHIGKRLRQRREELNITQATLAAALGITFQQIQKYEAGKNRIAASRLFIAARQLQVPMAYFVEDIIVRISKQLCSRHPQKTAFRDTCVIPHFTQKPQSISPPIRRKLALTSLMQI